MKINDKNKIFFYSSIVIGFLGMLFFEFADSFIEFGSYSEWISKTFSRFMGGLVCVMLAVWLSGKHILVGNKNVFLKRTLAVLPCFAVAINNFPFLSVAFKELFIEASFLHVILYATFCLSVGLFEEMAFRGCVFASILGRKSNSRISVLLSIFISSAVFGAIHVVNLFSGASPISVILQIGYSFLIGALCSVVFVKTANIWYCVLLHSIYNFAGGVAPQFGMGKIWTVPTVALTVAVAVAVTVYTVIMWYRLDDDEIYYFVNGKHLTQEVK